MKSQILIATLFFSQLVLAGITADEINNSDSTLVIADSRGPKHKEALSEAAYEAWEQIEDLGNLIDDGLIHDVYEDESCVPADAIEVYEMEFDDYSIDFTYESVKRKAGARSVAYILTPVVTYTFDVGYFKSEADWEYGEVTWDNISCDATASTKLYFGNPADRSIVFIGTNKD